MAVCGWQIGSKIGGEIAWEIGGALIGFIVGLFGFPLMHALVDFLGDVFEIIGGRPLAGTIGRSLGWALVWGMVGGLWGGLIGGYDWVIPAGLITGVAFGANNWVGGLRVLR
jgi:hypothetical protein